jgi:hypothetical protein
LLRELDRDEMLNNFRQELETRSDYLRCVCVGRVQVSKSSPQGRNPFLTYLGNSHSVRRAPRLPSNFGASRQFFPNSPARYPPSNVKRSATGSFKRLASLSKVSNDGAFLPRSIRLRKSTDMSSISANCSWVIRRCVRICRKRRPNFSLRVVTWTLFPTHKDLLQRTFAFTFLPEHATGKGQRGLFLCSYF